MTAPTTGRIPVAVEQPGTVSGAVGGGGPDSGTVRIRASDLREAQQLTHRVRGEQVQAGRDPGALTVLVDVDVVIAPVAREARVTFSLLPDRVRVERSVSTICYVGTPEGLVTLIADIAAAKVADGVTLIPLDGDGSTRLITEHVLPLLDR